MPAKPKPAAKKAAPAKPPLPKQARSHPSLEWWLSQPDNVARLKHILADPVFVAACAYVEGTMAVTPEDLIGNKAALDEVIVRKAALSAGVKTFVVAITALPNFRKQQATDVPEPWGHIQAPIR
jgi:hypothetical protein